MTYELFIGDRTFSSWSLRGWLMLHKFNLPYREHMVGLYGGTMAQDMTALATARLVPALRTPEGDVVGESLAVAETLAERHPEIAMCPAILLPASAHVGSAPRWSVGLVHYAATARCSWLMSMLISNPLRPSKPILRVLKRSGHLRGKKQLMVHGSLVHTPSLMHFMRPFAHG
jgi:glutathione S-transferase|tara:strand:+ start:357 stop:875 length:519 start_codon:yes stop_codon:yes gene_type:complete